MNTQVMAEAVAEGLQEAGCEVDLFNTNEGGFDVTTFPEYDCAAFGSPDYYSYVAGNLKQLMDDHYIADVRKGMRGLKDKPYVLFYSHGGGGCVIEAMKRIFRRVGRLVGESVASRGYPSPSVLEECKSLGQRLVESVEQE
jgi:flavorubredoxin